jgi:hypothetical protein
MWVVVLGSHLPYHQSACWGPFSDQATAEQFAAYVTAEIDPAQVIRAADPVSELLNWREHIALATPSVIQTALAMSRSPSELTP